MRRPLLVALWLIATAATTAVAYVAVNAAGAEVTDRPLTSVVATGETPTSPVRPSASTVTTTPTSGSATSATGSTSANTSSPAWEQRAIPSTGGLVIVSYRPGEVRLESVAPTPGFRHEIDEAGPPEVRVEFEGAEARVEVRVRWDGGLVTEVDED